MATTAVKRKACKVLVRKPGGTTLGRPRGRWENNMKISVKQDGCELD